MKIRFTLLLLMVSSMFCFAQKKVYIPQLWSTDPALSQWSYAHSYQTADFALFWGPLAGDDPKSNPVGTSLHFDPKFITDTMEYIFNKYINQYHLISNDSTTLFGKYKTIIVMTNTWGPGGPIDFAVGSQYDNTVAAIFVDQGATLDGGVTSHEFTHSIQSMFYLEYNRVDNACLGNEYNDFAETHANLMRDHIYPADVAVDFPRWLGTQNFLWKSLRHHYDAFDLPFYMEQLDSLNIVSDLWKKSLPYEDPLQTYKRIKGYSQPQFNDFMYEYAKRQPAYDYDIYGIGKILRAARDTIKSQSPELLWRQYVILDSIGKPTANGGRFVVPDAFAPQDYGFNIIPLYPTCTERNVFVKFKGHTEVNSVAGWRYGFVATKPDGTVSRYSPVYSDAEKQIGFQMTDGEANLYLVVVGAPTQYVIYKNEPGWPKIYRYPYELNISNALPESYQPNYRQNLKVNGHVHPNGGGWVSNTSNVDASVKIGPKAVVLGNSTITGSVVIDGTAFVEDETISGNVQVHNNSNITQGSLSDNVVIKGNAVLVGVTANSAAVFEANTLEYGGQYGGSVIVGGDAEVPSASVGVYLQTPYYLNGRAFNDGKGASDTSNIDINKPYFQFSEAQMAFSGNVSCSGDGIPDTTSTGDTTVVTPPKLNNRLKVAIYPNPVSDVLTLHVDNQFKTSDLIIQVFTTSGKKVMQMTTHSALGSSILTYSTSGLDNQLYYVKITGGDSTLKLKFVKQ